MLNNHNISWIVKLLQQSERAGRQDSYWIFIYYSVKLKNWLKYWFRLKNDMGPAFSQKKARGKVSPCIYRSLYVRSQRKHWGTYHICWTVGACSTKQVDTLTVNTDCSIHLYIWLSCAWCIGKLSPRSSPQRPSIGKEILSGLQEDCPWPPAFLSKPPFRDHRKPDGSFSWMKSQKRIRQGTWKLRKGKSWKMRENVETSTLKMLLIVITSWDWEAMNHHFTNAIHKILLVGFKFCYIILPLERQTEMAEKSSTALQTWRSKPYNALSFSPVQTKCRHVYFLVIERSKCVLISFVLYK